MPRKEAKPEDGLNILRKGLDKAREIAKQGQVFPDREQPSEKKRPKKEKS